jgi:nucleotide-binding universal stress UspA family protein
MRPVLAAVSLSPGSPIVQSRAMAVARAAGAPLHLVHVLRPFEGEKARRSALARLHLAAARLRDEIGLPVGVSLARGRVARAIAARAAALGARAIVMGAGRRASRVQRRAGVPVLAVRGGQNASYRRVLVAAELSPHDEHAIAYVRRAFPEARLGIVHVFEWAIVRPLRSWFLDDALLSLYRGRALAQAAAAVRRFADRNGVAQAVLESRRAEVPAALRLHGGDFRAELLVLSPEKSWLKTALGASVTRRVLADPPCDLLLLPRIVQPDAQRIPPRPANQAGAISLDWVRQPNLGDVHATDAKNS